MAHDRIYLAGLRRQREDRTSTWVEWQEISCIRGNTQTKIIDDPNGSSNRIGPLGITPGPHHPRRSIGPAKTAPGADAVSAAQT